MTNLLTELAAVEAGHPRFVSPKGDRRYRKVPCRQCGHLTLAFRPTVCGRCDPISDAGSAAGPEGGDVHSPRPERDVTATPANENSAHAGCHRLGA